MIAVNRSPFKEAVQGVSEIRADISDLSSLQVSPCNRRDKTCFERGPVRRRQQSRRLIG